MEVLLHAIGILVVVLAVFTAVPLVVSPLMACVQGAARRRELNRCSRVDNDPDVTRAA